MAKFSLKHQIRLVIKGAVTSVIPNAQGIPIAVNTPGRSETIPAGIYTTDDQEIIERIRKDQHYNKAEGIIEITEEEEEAQKIREDKLKEADAEIKARKRAKQK